MRFPNKKYLLGFIIVSIFFSIYIISYYLIRQHRLSIGYLASNMAFSSQEDAEEWILKFPEEQRNHPLIYGDAPLLYIIFWPIIHLDSKISGREVETPIFGVEPYKVPESEDSEPTQIMYIKKNDEAKNTFSPLDK